MSRFNPLCFLAVLLVEEIAGICSNFACNSSLSFTLCGAPAFNASNFIPQQVTFTGNGTNLTALHQMPFQFFNFLDGTDRCPYRDQTGCLMTVFMDGDILGVFTAPLIGEAYILLKTCDRNFTLPTKIFFSAPTVISVSPTSAEWNRSTQLYFQTVQPGDDARLTYLEFVNASSRWDRLISKEFKLEYFSHEGGYAETLVTALTVLMDMSSGSEFETQLRLCNGFHHMFPNVQDLCSNTLSFSFTKSISSHTASIPTNDNDKPPQSQNSNWLEDVLAPVVAGTLGAALLAGLVLLVRRERRRKRRTVNLEDRDSIRMALLKEEQWDDHWNIDSAEVEFNECVGSGGFAIVYKFGKYFNFLGHENICFGRVAGERSTWL